MVKKFARKVFKRRGPKRTAKVSKTVKKYVKKEISRNVEDKVAVYYPNRAGITATDVATGPLSIQCFPNIQQGVEVCDRVGNKINIKSCVLRYYLARASTTGVAAVPLIASVVIGRLKNDYDSPSLADFNLLKYGSSAAGAVTTTGIYSSDMRTVMGPFFEDVWDVKYFRQFKLWNSSNATNLYWNNNDFKLTSGIVQVNLTKWMKKVWTYMNATNNFPENEGLYVMFYVNTLDDTAAPTQAIFVDACINCKFQDA